MPNKPVRVSQLNAYLARLIAADSVLSNVAVTGEISNFKLHGSGHVFFSLKDEASRIECFLPSGIYRSLGFDIKDGAEIVAEGYVNVYEKGGRYSLTIRKITLAGQGDLSIAFEQLKKKLSEKGYFSEERKKPLPFFPLKIAIITSNTGAALSDMLKIISSRNSVAEILVFPTLVQGEGAAVNIASRLRQANEQYPDIDVIILGRGGGSAEDLAAFNEEVIADAIFDSKIPVISAVGHETDFTISDFVADKRAETPTAAAVLAAPDTSELRDDVDMIFAQIKGNMTSLVSNIELRVRANSLNALISRLKYGITERKTHAGALISGMQGIMSEMTRQSELLKGFMTTMRNAVKTKIERETLRIDFQVEKLKALDPKQVLSRGYAIIEDENGKTVSCARELTTGNSISARFSDGYAAAEIKEVMLHGK